MLIRDAEIGIDRPRIVDLRIEDGRIRTIADHALPARSDEIVIDAGSGALLPGLHDHHLHLHALAAARESVICGPPQVHDVDGLQRALHERHRRLADGQWLRGVGYHESVAGEIDRDWLDRCGPPRPLRIQHRSGRLWLLNSLALQELGALADGAETPLERDSGGRCTGRLYDADDWLRACRPRTRPSLHAISRELADLGVTGVTDATPGNDENTRVLFESAMESGELLQRLLMMGAASLDEYFGSPGAVNIGAHKFHLHEADLPDFDTLCTAIGRSHALGRAAAFHCVTRTDLAFALTALVQAGVLPGDRIEHASIAPPEWLQVIREQGVAVVCQPNFVAERGDAYLEEVDRDDLPWLYRLRGFVDAGIAMAGSTDAPFGNANPWKAMQAAVMRRSPKGAVIGPDECLSPEQALELFLKPADVRMPRARQIETGAIADLCLLNRPWRCVREALHEVVPRMTLRGGVLIGGAL